MARKKARAGTQTLSRRRQISPRAYDHRHMTIAADVVDGKAIAARLTEYFDNAAVAYVHLHNAKPGCFSCVARRVRSHG